MITLIMEYNRLWVFPSVKVDDFIVCVISGMLTVEGYIVQNQPWTWT